MRDPRVDARRNSRFHHFADVDPSWRAAKVERRDVEAFVLGKGDLVHLHRRVDRVAGLAADKGDDGWGCGHGKAANACRFGDRAVANVGVGVGDGVAGEIEAVRLFAGRGKPLVTKPADADAKIRAVARHRADNRAAFDAMRGVTHGFTRGHYRVEHAERIVAQKF